MKTLYKATILYFIGSILTRFTGFLLLPLYTNILTPAEYGNYALLIAIYAILNVLYQAGLFQGFIRFFYDEDSESKKVFSTTLNTIILFGFLVSVVLSLLHKPLISVLSINENLSSLLVLIFWLIFFDTIAHFGLQFLKTKQLAKTAVRYALSTALLNLILNVIFLVVLDLNILGIFLAQGLANFLLLFLCMSHFKGYYLKLIDWKLLSKLVLFSLPLVIAGFFGIMMDVADRFIINHFMDRSQVGVYSLAYKLGLLMNVFVIAFRTAYLPYFLSLSKTGTLFSELKSALTNIVTLMAILFFTVTIFVRYLFRIEIAGYTLINPDYFQAIYIVPFILLAYVFNGFSAFFSLAPYISGKSYHFIITDMIGFTVNILLNFILIPHYGIMGAAIATLVGYYVATLYMYFVFHVEFRKNLFGKEIMAIVAGLLFFLYAASLFDVLVIRIALLLLYILFSLKIGKVSLKSFFRLTTK